jgi:hypothetical protein
MYLQVYDVAILYFGQDFSDVICVILPINNDYFLKENKSIVL